MFDEDLARIRAHRSNIHRYRRLLKTRLSDLEPVHRTASLPGPQAAVAAMLQRKIRLIDSPSQRTMYSSGEVCSPMTVRRMVRSGASSE